MISLAFDDQALLDSALDKERILPLLSHEFGPIPKDDVSYAPLRAIMRSGLRFTYRELLHAAGCKLTGLPASARTEALKAAYFLVHHIDIDTDGVHVLRFDDADMVRIRSQMLGIAFTCLLAHKLWHFPWDQLQPIPGRGKRFDFRAAREGLTARFEAKGTSSFESQNRQIQNGLQKKKAEQSRGFRPDVHLVASAAIQVSPRKSRLCVADPSEDQDAWFFSKESELFFRLRHFSRVARFASQTRLSYELNATARAMLPKDFVDSRSGGDDFRYYRDTMRVIRVTRRYQLSSSARLEVDGQVFIGKWSSSWYPPDHWRRTDDALREARLRANRSPIEVFQGLREDVVAQLDEGAIEKLALDEGPLASVVQGEGFRASIFPDGSILAFRVMASA